jgi:hypothetical protein
MPPKGIFPQTDIQGVSLIIARTEFYQAQFKIRLSEQSVGVNIIPAGFSLVWPNQELFQVVLSFPSLSSFGKKQNFKWFTKVPAVFLPNSLLLGLAMIGFIIILIVLGLAKLGFLFTIFGPVKLP